MDSEFLNLQHTSAMFDRGFEQMMSGFGHLMSELKIECLGYKGTYYDFLCIIFNAFEALEKCKNMKEFFFPIFTLIKDITSSTYSEVTLHFMKMVQDLFKLCFKQIEVHSKNIFVAESDTPFISQVRKFFSKKNLLIDSEFGKRLSSFCSLVICLPIFRKIGINATSFGFSHVVQKRISKMYDNSHVLTLWEAITDNTLFFIEKMLCVYETGNLSCIIYDDTMIAKFDEEYAIMQHYYERMEIVENSGMTLEEFYRQADALIDRCEKFMKNYKEDRSMVKMLENRKLFLMRCKLKASDKLRVDKERKPPMAFVFYGPPGIGKTAFNDKTLVMLYQNEMRLGISHKPYDVSMKYVFSQNDKFYSGFRVSHEVMLIDDVDQFNNDILKAQGGGGIAATIDLINEVPYSTAQADLPNKGMIPFLAKYVMMTSNSRDAGVVNVFKKTSGALRRFIFIDLHVKPEYCKPNTTMLQGTGNPDDHDMYMIRARRYDALEQTYQEKHWDPETCTWKSELDNNSGFMDMANYQKFLFIHQKNHYNREDLTKESLTRFRNAGLCEKCFVNSAICYCPKGQFPEVEFRAESSFFFQEPTLLQYIYMFICLWWRMPRRQKIFALNLVFDEIKWKWYNNTTTAIKIVEQSRQNLFKRFNVVTFVAALIALRGLSSLYSLYRSNKKEENDEEFIAEGPRESKTNNPWLVSFKDVTRVKGVPSTVTLEQLQGVLESNVCHLNVYAEGCVPTPIKALGICGNTLVIPKHFGFKEHKCYAVDIIRHDLRSQAGPSCWKISIDDFCYSEIEGTDIATITHPSFGCFRDIRKFMLNKMVDGKCTGKICYRDNNGIYSTYPIYMIEKRDVIRYIDDDVPYNFPGYMAHIGMKTQKGDCGSPYIISTNNGHILAGFHVAGRKDHNLQMGMCIPLYSYYFEGNKIGSFGGIDLKHFYETDTPVNFVAQAHSKSIFHELKGNCTVLGEIDSFRPKLKSDVRETLMCKDVLDKFNMLEPSHVSPKGVSYREALKLNLEPAIERPDIPYHLLRKAQNAIVHWFERKIEECGIEIPNKPYDRFVGINGLDGKPYLNRLPANTSGGFLHKGRKDKYFIQVEPDSCHSLKYDFCPEIMHEYNKLIESYSNGERANVVWNFCFKDEPISVEKHSQNKVRIFSAGPLAYMVLFRQYFLWFVDIAYGPHRHHFGMACGANAMGRDWDVLYKYITRHGRNRVIAGDYSKFDKKANSLVLTIAYSVLINIMSRHGWERSDIDMAIMLMSEITHPLVNCFNTLIMLDGCHQSGQPLTTPGNGIVNILYMMCACMQICENENIPEPDWSRFYDYFSILTYGDDNIASSSIDEFNHTAISEVLSGWGIKYTMADKESESRPFINISEADFLKRKFVPHVNRKGSIAAPLEEASIIKSLTVATYMKNITFEEQCAMIIESASREYYMYGKAKFEEMRSFLQDLLWKYNLSSFLPRGRLLTYIEIQELYDSYEVFESTSTLPCDKKKLS